MHFLSFFVYLAALAKAPHNFGPVSSRDNTLYTACRPGNPPGKTDAVSNEAVQEWIHFMKDSGVSKVVCLLDDNEYANYDMDLCKQYCAGGLQVFCQEMRAEGASAKINEYIESAAKKGEKVVAHCTGGVGRAGRVGAGWLVHRYGLTPAEATRETLAMAKDAEVNRKGDVDALSLWLAAAV